MLPIPGTDPLSAMFGGPASFQGGNAGPSRSDGYQAGPMTGSFIVGGAAQSVTGMTAQIVPGWSDALERVLWPAAMRDHLGGIEMLQNDVSRGGSRAIEIYDGDDMVAAVVLRAERFPYGTELLIQSAAGRLPGASLTDAVLPIIEHIAVQAGCQSVRLHTSRKGFAPSLARNGFAPAETVYRKVIHGRRQIQ